MAFQKEKTMSIPRTLDGVSVETKANVYFDGKVVSHTVLEKNGRKKTVGLIFPGTYKFNTGAPEKMTIVAGSCRIVLASGAQSSHEAGGEFRVPGNSSFTITVQSGICEYLCEFLGA